MNITTCENIEQYSDLEIIQAILSGKRDLFEILIRRYNPVLYKIGRSYGGNHCDTEDLMQETFIRCYQSLSKFENRSTFKSWLIRIMLNQCYYNSKLSYNRNPVIELSLNKNSGSMLQAANSTNPEASFINKELKQIIEDAINELPEDYRITFTLRELRGLSVAETAQLLNVNASNVKVRVNRAKMMLRKVIKKNILR